MPLLDERTARSCETAHARVGSTGAARVLNGRNGSKADTSLIPRPKKKSILGIKRQGFNRWRRGRRARFPLVDPTLESARCR
jgi:hypothetical protein